MREEFVFFQAQDHFSLINCLPLHRFYNFFFLCAASQFTALPDDKMKRCFIN